MWLFGYIVGTLAAIVDLILIIVSVSVPEDSAWGAVVVLTIVVAGLFFSSTKARKTKKAQKEHAAAQNRPFMEDSALTLIEQGGLPVIVGTPVILEEGEASHYYAPAIRSVTKTRVVGHTGGGAGVSVRVAKGVSVRTGGGSSRNVRSDVTDDFTGAVVLTNRRLVFLHNQAGFECRLTSVSAVTPTAGSVLIQAGSKSYQVTVARSDLFETVLQSVIGQ